MTRRISIVFIGFCLLPACGIAIIVHGESLAKNRSGIYAVTGFTLNGKADEMRHRVLSHSVFVKK